MSTQKKIQSMCAQADKNKAFDSLAYYYERWQDEKEYEDWNDYDQAIKKSFANFPVCKTTKRPFGFHFRIDGKTFKMVVKATKKQLRFDVVA